MCVNKTNNIWNVASLHDTHPLEADLPGTRHLLQLGRGVTLVSEDEATIFTVRCSSV